MDRNLPSVVMFYILTNRQNNYKRRTYKKVNHGIQFLHNCNENLGLFVNIGKYGKAFLNSTPDSFPDCWTRIGPFIIRKDFLSGGSGSKMDSKPIERGSTPRPAATRRSAPTEIIDDKHDKQILERLGQLRGMKAALNWEHKCLMENGETDQAYHVECDIVGLTVQIDMLQKDREDYRNRRLIAEAISDADMRKLFSTSKSFIIKDPEEKPKLEDGLLPW